MMRHSLFLTCRFGSEPHLFRMQGLIVIQRLYTWISPHDIRLDCDSLGHWYFGEDYLR